MWVFDSLLGSHRERRLSAAAEFLLATGAPWLQGRGAAPSEKSSQQFGGGAAPSPKLLGGFFGGAWTWLRPGALERVLERALVEDGTAGGRADSGAAAQDTYAAKNCRVSQEMNRARFLPAVATYSSGGVWDCAEEVDPQQSR